MTHDPFAAARPLPSLPPVEPLDGRRPRLLAHLLRYMDWHQGGAETSMHRILKGLQARGWEVQVAVMENRAPLPLVREWDGIRIQVLTDQHLAGPYAWCDLAITHLDVTPGAMAWARSGRPLLHYVHHHLQRGHHKGPDDGLNIAVFNSAWIRDAVPWSGPSIVCRPPVVASAHRTTNAKRSTAKTATLVNLLGEKGGDLFWRVAARLPDWTFLGVTGSYGYQTPAPDLPNVEVSAPSTDMAPVWKRTSVVAVPSWYESFSLSGTEAMASGIAVVASPTAGLVESMTSPEHGPCAVFADWNEDDQWVAALERLATPAEWRKQSKLSKVRSGELDVQTTSDLDRLDVFCRSLLT